MKHLLKVAMGALEAGASLARWLLLFRYRQLRGSGHSPEDAAKHATNDKAARVWLRLKGLLDCFEHGINGQRQWRVVARRNVFLSKIETISWRFIVYHSYKPASNGLGNINHFCGRVSAHSTKKIMGSLPLI